MAKNFQIDNVILQYVFLERVNPISNKFSFNCLIPQDHPQVQTLIDACSAEWLKVSAGAPESSAQSIGYTLVAPNDPKKIEPSVAPLLDPTKNYYLFKGVQDANTTTPTRLFDTTPTEFFQRDLIGSGTIANVNLSAFGYSTSGQKGVKLYGQWIQVVKLVENPYAGGAAPAPVETGGFVADESLTAPAAPQQPVQPMNAAPAAPGQLPPAAPVGITPVQAPVNQAPAAPVGVAPVG